jgi:hypothetical protein
VGAGVGAAAVAGAGAGLVAGGVAELLLAPVPPLSFLPHPARAKSTATATGMVRCRMEWVLVQEGTNRATAGEGGV